jgi:hypothetical protein
MALDKMRPGTLAASGPRESASSGETCTPDYSRSTIDKATAARRRAEAVVMSWSSLDGWERGVVTGFTARQTGAGWPLPPFTSYIAEARAWTRFSPEAELEAYAWAIVEAMRPERRRVFAHWLTEVAR